MFRLRFAVSAVALITLLAAASLVAAPLPAARKSSAHAASKLSHIRIVRVSLAQEAQVKMSAGAAWRRALPNMPITQGEALRTGANGRAEVEFEDGSTVRLIPNSKVVFQQLALSPKGVRLNGVAVLHGTAFFSLHPKDSRAFRAIFPEGVVTVPRKKAEFQIAVSGQQSRLQMLGGHTEVAAAGQPYRLKKGDLLTLNEQAPAELTKAKANSAWDKWNHHRDQVMEADVSRRGRDFNGDAWYGMGMLSAYGNWNGNFWYPSGMPMGWNPYMNGTWFFDPAMGYMWDSFYPWGWAPFHYGQWMDTAMGWAWSPMGGMMFEPYPMALYTGGGFMALPPRPPAPPVALHRAPVGGITIARSGGITAPTRILATPAWNAMQARIAAAGRTKIALRTAARSGRYDRAQMNALRRSARTQQRDLQRQRQGMWMRQQEQAYRRGQMPRAFGMRPGARGGPGPMGGPRMGGPARMPMGGAPMGGPRMGSPMGGGMPHGGGVVRH